MLYGTASKNQQYCVLPTECIYVFIGLDNRDRECSLNGKNCILKCNLG